MKKRLLMLLLLCGGVASAQTIVQQYTAISQGYNVSDMDLKQPTAAGSVLIAMPVVLTPGLKVLSVTDDQSNTYKQVSSAAASCGNRPVNIWYCENCKPGVMELKFHLSGRTKGSLNSFIELSNMATSDVVDGSGAQLSDATAAGTVEAGPSITTTTKDFIVARYFPTDPLPTGVTPAAWSYTPSYVYMPDAAPGTYQPTLTGGKAGANFCMSVAAFKIGAPVATVKTKKK